eukprot:TRINITY_DN1147_c0_g1_i1.p1 TRINITY_DN1147_c0_g1~~TRINITY_DN1147_c0_g1_i1.p1  ORF type:complete len:341 (+),score=104.08 TRINITY_DN1147_c0_g1_i1:111-1133(+)
MSLFQSSKSMTSSPQMLVWQKKSTCHCMSNFTFILNSFFYTINAYSYIELVKDHSVEYIAGGAAQNTIRAAQWMLQVPKATTYVGCIGKDQFGEELKKAAVGDGVTVQYQIDEDTPTGTCAVLITDKERSLVANLGAAQKFKDSFLSSPEVQASVEKAKIFYTTGYFLIVTPEGVAQLGKHAAQHNKIFVLNISAPFIVDFFTEKLNSIVPYADYIIANESEAQAYGKKAGWGEDLEEIAKKLSALPKENSKRPRTVVFTQGASATIVFDGSQLHQFKPDPIDPALIVDTNGAGDTFAGGFLSQLVQGKPLEKCVAAGHYCAGLCIQTSGCKFSGKPNFA